MMDFDAFEHGITYGTYRKEISPNFSRLVRDGIEYKPVISSVGLDRLSKSMLCSVADKFSTPAEVLSILAGDASARVRSKVAGNPATMVSVLSVLASDSSKIVRRAVALNFSTSAEALRRLAADADNFVRWNAFVHPLTPTDALAKLIPASVEDMHKIALEPEKSSWWKQAVAKLKIANAKWNVGSQIQIDGANLISACEGGDILYLPEGLVAKFCRKSGLAWRLLGLASRYAEPAALAKRSRSVEWLERMAVARNANTPSNVIKMLCEDPHRLVALQAKATLRNKVENAHQIPQ